MYNGSGKQSQTTLLLRLLGGGYLLYLGISILTEGTATLPMMGGAALFILAGAGLLLITLPAVLRQIKGTDGPDSGEE